MGKVSEKEYRSVRIVFSPDRLTARQYREIFNVLVAGSVEISETETDYMELDRNRAYIQRRRVCPECQAAIQEAFNQYIDGHKAHRYHVSLEYDECIDEIVGGTV